MPHPTPRLRRRAQTEIMAKNMTSRPTPHSKRWRTCCSPRQPSWRRRWTTPWAHATDGSTRCWRSCWTTTGASLCALFEAGTLSLGLGRAPAMRWVAAGGDRCVLPAACTVPTFGPHSPGKRTAWSGSWRRTWATAPHILLRRTLSRPSHHDITLIAWSASSRLM